VRALVREYVYAYVYVGELSSLRPCMRPCAQTFVYAGGCSLAPVHVRSNFSCAPQSRPLLEALSIGYCQHDVAYPCHAAMGKDVRDKLLETPMQMWKVESVTWERSLKHARGARTRREEVMG
jgi:hypothetical protein